MPAFAFSMPKPQTPPPFANIKQACAILQAGGIILYQTETWCALGALCANAAANAAICRIKGRPQGKPLPLIAANVAQAAVFADLDQAPAPLISRFWPGPLSLILPALQKPAPQVTDKAGNVCLRVSASPVAAALACCAGMPVSASSANFSGRQPQVQPGALPADFLQMCCGCGLPFAVLKPDDSVNLAENDNRRAKSFQPCPQTRVLPSSIVRPVRQADGWRLEILREGAIPATELARFCKPASIQTSHGGAGQASENNCGQPQRHGCSLLQIHP